LRAALGATRARLVRQMLIEAVALASAGGLLGVASAFWILRGLVAIAPLGLPRLETIVIDRFVLTFTIALAVVCSVILGTVTASRAQKIDLEATLRQGGRSHGAAARRPLQHALIVAEVALTLALVCGAGLLLRSLGEVRRLPLGFESTNTLLFRTVVPNEFSSSQRHRFFEEAAERVHRLPGVRAVGVVSNIFPTRAPDATILVDAKRDGPRGRPPVLDDVATPDFFSALRVPLRKGRYFGRSDEASVSHVAVVNERFAREFWGDDDPVGRRFHFLDKRHGDAWVTVVGMIADMRRNGLEQVPYPQVFLPFAQSPSRGADLVIHTDVPPFSLANNVTRTIAEIDPSVPVYRLSTLEQRLDEFQTNRRFQAWVLSLFASVAILLAAVGMYGVIRYDVTQRTQEIGVRIAVGASSADVVALVLRNGLALTGAGLVIGELTAVALAGLMAALVFGISTRDPVTFVLAPLLLLAVAVAACLEPAWRALRVDPLRALKAE
jgi:putative ABC transport system permease protein